MTQNIKSERKKLEGVIKVCDSISAVLTTKQHLSKQAPHYTLTTIIHIFLSMMSHTIHVI